MAKQNLKKGDEVIVITGAEKGKKGKILSIISSKDKVLVEGLNIVKRHTKSQPQANVEGGIIEKESPIHISNVMSLAKFEAKKNAKK